MHHGDCFMLPLNRNCHSVNCNRQKIKRDPANAEEWITVKECKSFRWVDQYYTHNLHDQRRARINQLNS